MVPVLGVPAVIVVDAHDEEPDEEGESGNLEGSTDDFKMQQPRISRRE